MTQISRSELDLIVCSIENISSNRQPCELSKKEQLKQLSDSRVAGWKDTLTAKRKAKLTWKAEKERLEEEQRKLQDAEEAALRGKLRNETLQHADNLLRENTEKVRQFRGQQMLVDTLITRDIQIQEREKMSQNEIEEEKQWHLSVINSMKEAEKKSIRDLENEKRRSEALVEDLKRQRDEREEQIRAQHLQKRQEEESIIKKMAMDDLAVERAKAQNKAERRNKAKEEMRKNEILLKTCQEEKLRKELEETRKCEAEVARRNKINAARIALEKKHFDEKQSMRNLLSDKASEELKQRAIREFEIFERDRQMRYQKELEKAEAARKKQEADKIAIEECRKNQIKYKMEQIEVDMKLGKLYVDELNRINKEKQESGRQKELAKRQQNLEIRKIQQQQCEENERRRVQENAELLRQEQHVFEQIKAEDDIFKDFVTNEIEKFKVQGKRTALLEKALIR